MLQRTLRPRGGRRQRRETCALNEFKVLLQDELYRTILQDLWRLVGRGLLFDRAGLQSFIK